MAVKMNSEVFQNIHTTLICLISFFDIDNEQSATTIPISCVWIPLHWLRSEKIVLQLVKYGNKKSGTITGHWWLQGKTLGPCRDQGHPHLRIPHGGYYGVSLGLTVYNWAVGILHTSAGRNPHISPSLLYFRRFPPHQLLLLRWSKCYQFTIFWLSNQ